MTGNSGNQEELYFIKQTLQGDNSAFSALIDRYKQPIFQLIYRKIPNKGDVEDLAQEVFLRVYKSLKRYDQKRKFSTWIYTIANNLCIDYLRKKRLRSVSLDAPLFPGNGEKELFLEIEDTEYEPQQVFQQTTEQQRLIEAIQCLPEEYSIILKLRHFKGLSYSQISELLDLPMGTVKSRIYRARSELKDIFLKKGGQKNGLSGCL